MSKVLLEKSILVLVFMLVFGQIVFTQENFKLNGQLLVDKKAIQNAEVIIFKGSLQVNKANTNRLGRFYVDLAFQQNYVIQFKKEGIPTQKILISTKVNDLDSDFTKSKVVVFALSSKNVSVEGPGTKDAVAAFQINRNGMLVEGKQEFSEAVTVVEDEELTTDNEIEAITNELEEIIPELDKMESEKLKSKYKQAINKVDSVVFLAEKKAALILQAADLKSKEIIEKAYYNLPMVIESKKEVGISNEGDVKKELKKLAIRDDKFLGREDIKAYKAKLDKFKNKPTISKKDSISYLETMVLFKDEMLRSAKLQFEIDKLSAQTKEDSVELQQRQAMIYLVEKEIEEAKGKIAIQEIEIKQKNTMLVAAIAALLFFVILFIVVYQNFKHKKRTNLILEKHNNEIAKKNKKIIDSIRYAQTIQQAILPIKSNIDKFFEWFVIFQPKDIVSGDFYWFNHFEETGKSVFAVVDCTGHGVPGAFMSMIGNRLLIEAVKEKGIEKPIDILEEIDASIRIALMQDETSNNDGMDMIICTIEYLNNKQCKIEFAGAKRPLFYSDKKDGMKFIKGTIRGIGGKKRIREKAKKQFQEHSLLIDKGEMIYLTTDGFFDLQSPNRKKFGRVNFMNLLQEHSNKSLTEQKEAVMEALYIHKGSEFQIDDITILGIKL